MAMTIVQFGHELLSLLTLLLFSVPSIQSKKLGEVAHAPATKTHSHEYRGI